MQKDTLFDSRETAVAVRDHTRSSGALGCVSPASFWMPQHIVESAWLEHAPFAFWLMDVLRPRTFVELGTHAGFSFLAFCQAVRQLDLSTSCYAIDTWLGDEHAGFYDTRVFDALSTVQTREFGDFSRLIRARFDEALSAFGDGTIDLLHVDGRHRYEDVVEDYSSWVPKLSECAVVLFHDTNVRERDFGVWRFWEELRTRFPSFEFIHGHGLGVLCHGPVIPDGIRPLLEASEADRASIRRIYGRLGAAVSLRYQLDVIGGQLGAAHSRIEERDTTVAQLQAQLQEQTHMLEQRSDEVEKLSAQLGEQADATRRKQSLIDRSAAHVETIKDIARGRCDVVPLSKHSVALPRDVFDVAHDRLGAELDELQSLVGELREETAAATSRQRELHARAERSEQELQHIQTSTMWRAFLKVRRIAEMMSPGLRRNVRKTLKAAWWIATPHRMPARLRFLKARRAAAAMQANVGDRALYPEGQYLVYKPHATNADTGRNRAGRYELSSVAGGYVYIPPRKPDDIDACIASLGAKPTFSIVVPLYNTGPELFDAMVGSVLDQWYPHWELVLVDDKSPLSSVGERLATLNDPRIKIIQLDRNLGISGATNKGLDAAEGDYIVFLDHDDELTCDCLFELAKCVAADNPDFIYSDEDKIETDGSYGQPFFKPDWSPDTMMSTMYTCHVSCVRRSLQQRIGGLRSEFDGCQDWDFVLRVVEQANKISHIRKVLYHWRVIPASVASDLNAKPYAVDAGRRARLSAIERRGLKGALEPVPQLPGYFRVRYAHQGDPKVSIIIPSKNNGDVLRRCVDSIRSKSTYRNFEIILIDNGSTNIDTLRTFDDMAAMSNIRVIRHDMPFNYSEINNIGVRESIGDFLVFLNDDTEVMSETWLSDMLGYAQLAHIGAVGAKLIYPGGRKMQHVGLVNLADGPGHAFLQQNADSPCYFARNLLEYNWIGVTGACLMLSREKFNRINGFDEAFPVAYNDVDLCFRLIKSGLYNVVCPGVELIHYESLSRGRDDANNEKIRRLARDKERLYLKHPDFFMFDPFHNPNLDQRDPNFVIPAA
ncbi:glycosyltransferase [Burkholderia multivorans]|uniref:glycosyltransferase family 2 protein n=1 Tax=Burkholderia multivorans TaxID=87883 RepID=UPI0009C12222|nr:glycosyltransferase [Burkholderia multivorans]AYY96514.1 glycosyltransferase [Burkholderia multivorans]MBU9120359.1 glycosyltransferase [Burkholderia multivorans]PRF48463.1 glycosyl transferase [Burkholderia multivorans]HEJ2438919.1 glycosyltransferase [Burkholderia multivorans]